MRILSVHPAATELLFALGAGDALVGRTDACDWPKNARKTPTIGQLSEISKVLVDVFEPELVVTGPGQEELVREIEAQYPVFSITPHTIEQISECIFALAQKIEKNVEAEMIVHDIEHTFAQLRDRTSRFRPMRVYCEVQHTPAHAADGYIAGILRAANAQPFIGEVTVEHLQEFNPQVILSCVPDEEENTMELIASRDGWNALVAVQHERMFCIPGPLLHRPGPRLIDGVKLLAKFLHGIEVK